MSDRRVSVRPCQINNILNARIRCSCRLRIRSMRRRISSLVEDHSNWRRVPSHMRPRTWSKSKNKIRSMKIIQSSPPSHFRGIKPRNSNMKWLRYQSISNMCNMHLYRNLSMMALRGKLVSLPLVEVLKCQINSRRMAHSLKASLKLKRLKGATRLSQ